jgi:mannose-1-phosphate guanylyltransferase
MPGTRLQDGRSAVRWEEVLGTTSPLATGRIDHSAEPRGHLRRVDPRTEPKIWAVILAGGEGLRLRPLTEYVCGDSRPKQFARLLGPQSLLRQTLERTALGIPWARTVVVAHRSHVAYLAEEFAGLAAPQVLLQPDDRGTAAAILLAAHQIAAREPDAIVAIFPSDHFIRGAAAFMHHIVAVAEHVRRHAGPLVLLGAVPTDPQPQYGWIRRGALLGDVGGEPLHRVAGFTEKPHPDAARIACARGDLWSTFVLVGAAQALLGLGWQAAPLVSERLAEIRWGTTVEQEAASIASAYARIARLDFSRGILEQQPSLLTVSQLPPSVVWSDWGTLDRVVSSLRAAGLTPVWMRDLDRGARLAARSVPD